MFILLKFFILIIILMFQNIEEVIDFYKKENEDKNKIIYNEFEKNIKMYPNLVNHFHKVPGYGELSFSWNWYLIIKSINNNFKFLEVGVYKGRVLSTISLLSQIHNKSCKIIGVTPLDNIGDKYSKYSKDDYYEAIKNNFKISNLSMDNVEIIKGLSQDINVLDKLQNMDKFDIIFIDGSHDYEIVCEDIKKYTEFLKVGGYFVMDDSSLYIKNPAGIFKGHPDVSKAVIDILDKDKRFNELYACGHNRVWQKIN